MGLTMFAEINPLLYHFEATVHMIIGTMQTAMTFSQDKKGGQNFPRCLGRVIQGDFLLCV